MRAVRYHAFGGPERVVLEDVPLPTPSPGWALVRVRAAGLNPVDTKILAGSFTGAAPPKTLGVDFAGELPDGRRVFGSGQLFGARHDGAFAEYVAAPEECLAPLPARLSFAQGAAVGVVFLTARLCLEAAALGPGAQVVVHGAGGGVGSAFLALARRSGARLFAVTSGPQGVARALRLGATEAIDRLQGDPHERLRALAPGGFDVVVDTVGGSYFEKGLALLAPRGRILSVGVTGGERARVELDLPSFYRKGAAILGVNTNLLGPAERGARLREIGRALETGEIELPEVETLPLERAAEALARVARYESRSKLVLVP